MARTKQTARRFTGGKVPHSLSQKLRKMPEHPDGQGAEKSLPGQSHKTTQAAITGRVKRGKLMKFKSHLLC